MVRIAKNIDSALKAQLEVLQQQMPEQAFKDINRKLSAIFILLPEACISIVNSDHEILAISEGQRKLFEINDGSLIGRKCYERYKGLNSICPNCHMQKAIKSKSTYHNPFKASCISDYGGKYLDPKIIVTNCFSVPCGTVIDGKYSHCINLNIDITENEEMRMHQRFLLHKFTREMFSLFQKRTDTHYMNLLLAFGCLYSISERHLEVCLYKLDAENPFSSKITEYIAIKKSSYSDELWNKIQNHPDSFHPKELAKNRMSRVVKKDNLALDSIGLNERNISSLKKGYAVGYANNHKIAVYIKGYPIYKLDNFILLAEKILDDSKRIFDFNEIAAISHYATFCRNVLMDWRNVREKGLISRKYNLLNELTDPKFSEAFIASTIISSSHNAAKIWHSFMLSTPDMIIDKLSPEVKKTEEMKALISTFKASKEALKNHFNTMNRYRHMSAVSLAKTDLVEAVNNAFSRYREQFNIESISFHFAESREVKKFYCISNLDYLEQVIVNLFQNSVDALYGIQGSKITVTVDQPSDGYCLGQLRLRVEDNGCGISPTDMEAIWVPEFTTKKYGTGRGLAFVKYAVEGVFKGSVYCSSKPYVKTVFSICIRRD